MFQRRQGTKRAWLEYVPLVPKRRHALASTRRDVQATAHQPMESALYLALKRSRLAYRRQRRA